MLFNSLSFALFLPIVFALYWFVFQRNLRAQNILLLVASYFFYACWDFRFLFLLIFSTLLDYFTAIKTHEAAKETTRKAWFWLSVIINLGFLAVFKYYNFFIESFAEGVQRLGFEIHPLTFSIILPVGISFYTFHGLSYVIDIYKRRIEPERNFVNYSVFVSFFPLLVAGPIERATHLLPQIQKPRTFEYARAVDGLRQILWGLFKKVVIADNCAVFVNDIFNNTFNYSGSTLVLAAVLFAFQIYCDFSGYSDIALGTARLFGIELLRNFAFPYFSRDIAEFWRRWHISLSSWFRDYLYIPLGGSHGGMWMKIRNTFIIFLVSGLWHGANWTFVIWGLLHALFFIPLLVFNKNRDNLETVAAGKVWPNVKELAQIVSTFSLVVFAWIFFRAENLFHAYVFVRRIFMPSLFSAPILPSTLLIILLFGFIVIEWVGRENKYAIEKLFAGQKRVVRWSFYYMLLIAMYSFSGNEQEFIYFQF
jgi:alginate O-acetyltransferase complex protein AlgI